MKDQNDYFIITSVGYPTLYIIKIWNRLLFFWWKLLLEGKNGQFHSIKQPKLGKSWAKASNILKFTFYHLFLYTSCPSSLTWSAKLFIATKARGLQWHIYFMIIVPKAYWQNHSRLHTMIQFSSICMHACPTRTTYWGN